VRSRWEYLRNDVIQGRKNTDKKRQQLLKKETGEKAYFLDHPNKVEISQKENNSQKSHM
jgi:hypothetical protein